MRLQALRAGAVEFLSKPFDDEILLDSVRAAMSN
jgi:FixJ family two-component response regulator